MVHIVLCWSIDLSITAGDHRSRFAFVLDQHTSPSKKSPNFFRTKFRSDIKLISRLADM